MKIRTVFQIIFCILAASSVLAASILGILYGFVYFLVGAAVALIFAVLMFLMKNGPQKKAEPQPDFMFSDEENEAIRKALEDAQQKENSDN